MTLVEVRGGKDLRGAKRSKKVRNKNRYADIQITVCTNTAEGNWKEVCRTQLQQEGDGEKVGHMVDICLEKIFRAEK